MISHDRRWPKHVISALIIKLSRL